VAAALWLLGAVAGQMTGDLGRVLADSSVVTVAGPPAPIGAEGILPPSACSTVVPAGTDIQSAINSAPVGATLCVEAGVFRVNRPLNPKANQKLIGTPNFRTTLNGAKIITGFAASGGNYVATGFLPRAAGTEGYCERNGCNYPQDVFVDGVQLTRVLTMGALKSGAFYEDFGANKIYLRDDPSGHLVEQSFSSSVIQSTVSGITIKGFIIEKSANPAQQGMIDAQNRGQSGWVISGNEVRFAHGVGIDVDSAVIQGNHIHHNGQLGVAGHGVGTLLDSNEIDHNNTQGYNVGWEAGGLKFALITGAKVTNNNVHDNAGMGLWCDVTCYDTTFSGNVVKRNTNGGIFYEISGKALIANNDLADNGPSLSPDFYSSGNIVVAASPNIEVYGNRVIGRNGIGVVQQSRTSPCDYRGSPTYPDGTPVCIGGTNSAHDIYVHDNDVMETGGGGVAGLNQDIGDSSYFTSKNIRFVHNTYHLPNLMGVYFIWRNTIIDVASWQAAGQDATGTFLSSQ
jgi:parallel beta-helix repeat protein